MANYLKEQWEVTVAQTNETAEEVRQMELARLDHLMSVFYPKALKGDLDAAKFVATLTERRAALLGLDKAPRGQAPAAAVQVNFNSMDRDELAQLARQYGIPVAGSVEEQRLIERTPDVSEQVEEAMAIRREKEPRGEELVTDEEVEAAQEAARARRRPRPQVPNPVALADRFLSKYRQDEM